MLKLLKLLSTAWASINLKVQNTQAFDIKEIKIYNFLITKASLWRIETFGECKACLRRPARNKEDEDEIKGTQRR